MQIIILGLNNFLEDILGIMMLKLYHFVRFGE
jgi:hypothetical protein